LWVLPPLAGRIVRSFAHAKVLRNVRASGIYSRSGRGGGGGASRDGARSAPRLRSASFWTERTRPADPSHCVGPVGASSVIRVDLFAAHVVCLDSDPQGNLLQILLG
jgi:hypothetical protein